MLSIELPPARKWLRSGRSADKDGWCAFRRGDGREWQEREAREVSGYGLEDYTG
jgi:hypothetical protein